MVPRAGDGPGTVFGMVGQNARVMKGRNGLGRREAEKSKSSDEHHIAVF